MSLTTKRRQRLQEEIERLIPQYAEAFPSRPRAKWREIRSSVQTTAKTGFGFAEILIIAQAIWMLYQLWQQYRSINPDYRPTKGKYLGPFTAEQLTLRAYEEVGTDNG